MKKLFTILLAIFAVSTAFAQAEKSIIIDQNTFRPVQKDALTGVNIDPIELDSSKRPCARLKVKINRMTREEINAIEVKIITNNQLTKNKTAEYDNGLILELTAKPQTRFYFHHDEFGDSNEVCLNLEADKEYYLEAYLNQQYPITVASNIEGADVYLDNVFKGQTGSDFVLVVKEVVPGNHTLRVEYGGVKSESEIFVSAGNVFFRQTVNVEASKPQFVVFAVEPQTAVVTIENNHYPLQDGAMRVVLNNGTYNYTVTAAGYHPQSGTFTVAGEKVMKSINLTADAATVTLTAPDNAEIWVNDEKKGVGSWSGSLVSGAYIFEARKAGHKSGSISQQITSAQPQQSYALPAPTPVYGSLMVDGSPLMADVALDGKNVGQTPLQLNNILIGEHALTVSKAGYAPKTQQITILESQTASVNISLEKGSPKAQTVAPSGKVYKVGDYYNDGVKEGVVFEVSADGRSGKIVSMQQTRLPYASVQTEIKRFLGADSRTDGKYNLAKVKEVPDWDVKYDAFKWCVDLGEDWYLPAIEELKKFTLDVVVYKLVNRTLAAKGEVKIDDLTTMTDFYDGWYWSSTEYNRKYGGIYCGEIANMRRNKTIDYYKPNHYKVRAIATFGTASQTLPTQAQTTTANLTSAPYKVGDYYNDGVKEGVVFEVTADGRHGKIVSMKQSDIIPWAEEGAAEYKVGANSETDGEYNTNKVKAIQNWQNNYPAFAWCASLGEGWYMPALKEFKSLIFDDAVHDSVNKTLESKGATKLYSKGEKGWYWASTEMANVLVYSIKVVGSYTLSIYNSRKSGNAYPVRAIAKF